MNAENLCVHSRGASLNELLEAAGKCLEAGNEEKARELALKACGVDCSDPTVLRGWAELCEELGMARKARECYEKALQLNPNDSGATYRLAALLAETGHFEKSLKHLRRLVRRDPSHKQARELLAQNYRGMGLTGQADALVPPPSSGESALPLRYFPPSISRMDTERLLKLFAGRETGYALQEIDPKTGEALLKPREGALTHNEIASHLLGEITLALFPLRSDNTVRYGGISLRLPEEIIQANLKSPGYLALLEEKLRRRAVLIVRLAADFGFNAYAEYSGAREYRVWFFFSEPAHFLKVKRFLVHFMDKAPAPEFGMKIELVLPTKPVGIGWIEQAVILPLGIHRPSAQRSLFLDSGGAPHREQLKLLKKVREIPLKRALEIFKKPGKEAKRGTTWVERISSDPVRLLVKKCAVVRELVSKAGSGRVLRREEKVVLFYTAGLLDLDGEALQSIFEPCPDYSFENVKRQWSRLKPNPVSCIKVRELIPEITSSVSCSCAFDLRGGKYTSPLLHVNAHQVPPAKEFLLPGSIPAREAASRYAGLRQHMEEVQTAISRLELILDQHYVRSGIDRMKIDGLVLRRTEEDGRVVWKLERF